MKRDRLQAKDIPDEVMLHAVAITPGTRGVETTSWRMRWDVHATLERLMGRKLPEKVVMAKAWKLMHQGRMHGCENCTCRGDWHLPDDQHPHCC